MSVVASAGQEDVPVGEGRCEAVGSAKSINDHARVCPQVEQLQFRAVININHRDTRVVNRDVIVVIIAVDENNCVRVFKTSIQCVDSRVVDRSFALMLPLCQESP